LARVHDYLLAWPTHAVVLLAVELCSLTLQIDDLSPESIVASTLFGDGAAAVLCVGENHPLVGRAALESLASTSRLYPNTKHIMGWDVGSHGFKILLDPGVPQLVKDFFADDVRRFLSQHNLETSDIRSWISHPGGPKVLQALTSSLDLTDDALSVSRKQLAQVGNLSSASVLGILKQTIIEHRDKIVKSGDHALMMAMGPGFCSEQLLCRWT
jgi:alkylresorcinol/alkylpyrone synthase